MTALTASFAFHRNINNRLPLSKVLRNVYTIPFHPPYLYYLRYFSFLIYRPPSPWAFEVCGHTSHRSKEEILPLLEKTRD